MESFRKFLIEDAKYDLEIRKEAKQVFDEMIKYLTNNKIYFEKHLNKSKEKFTNTPEDKKDKETIGFRLKVSDFMDGYDDLKINIIGADERERGSFFTWKRWFKFFHHIYLNVLEFDDTLETFIQRLKQNFDSTFLHEFVHYKDSKRFKLEDPRHISYPTRPKRENFKSDFLFKLAKEAYNDAYYSNDMEMNAFFQKIIFEFERQYESLEDMEKREVQNNFKYLLKLIVPLLKRYMIQHHLNEKDKNRIIKRLYKYWDELHAAR